MKPALGRSTDASEIGRINRLVTFARRHITEGPGPVLDYGCGNMVVMSHLWDYYTDIIGYEWGDDGLTVPFFRAVVCFDVLEHTADQRRTMEHIVDLLPSGAVLALTAPNRWWLFETHASRPWNRLVGFNWGPWRHWLRRKVGRNVPCYTKREITELLEAAGFDIVDIGYQVAPLDNAPWLRKLVWNWHTTKIPFFAVDICVVGVKRG